VNKGDIVKKAVLLASVLFLVAIPVLAKDDDAEIRAVIEKYAAAWGSLNPDNAAPLYAKDADLVFYDLLPLKYAGWSAYAEGVKPHFAQFESLKITPKGDLKAKGEGADTMALETRQTLILEKQGGDWKIVHEHFSTPLAMHEHDPH